MPPIVAIDLETTGLDPASDAIIEIGAQKFDGQRIEGEWSSLINPGRSISNFITKLTGISNPMVRDAPQLEEVLPELVDFVGDAPVLGHRVSFDLGFLRRAGVLKLNDSIDTYDMAAVLLPQASRYNLGSLGKQLNILFPATHRALDDAKVTVGVYQQLYLRLLELPMDLLAEIVRMGEQRSWGGEWPFKQALKERLQAGAQAATLRAGQLSGPLFETPEPGEVEARQGMLTDSKEIDPEEAAAPLEHGGAFSHFPL